MSFNPTMVRLLHVRKRKYALREARFNPTMVRLLLTLRSTASPSTMSFNPTMVRLLLQRRTQRRLVSGFQSHNGAIAAGEFTHRFEQVYGFNPTMVRLLPN